LVFPRLRSQSQHGREPKCRRRPGSGRSNHFSRRSDGLAPDRSDRCSAPRFRIENLLHYFASMTSSLETLRCRSTNACRGLFAVGLIFLVMRVTFAGDEIPAQPLAKKGALVISDAFDG